MCRYMYRQHIFPVLTRAEALRKESLLVWQVAGRVGQKRKSPVGEESEEPGGKVGSLLHAHISTAFGCQAGLVHITMTVMLLW